MSDDQNIADELKKLEEHHIKYHHRFEIRRTIVLAILTIIVSMLLIYQVF